MKRHHQNCAKANHPCPRTGAKKVPPGSSEALILKPPVSYTPTSGLDSRSDVKSQSPQESSFSSESTMTSPAPISELSTTFPNNIDIDWDGVFANSLSSRDSEDSINQHNQAKIDIEDFSNILGACNNESPAGLMWPPIEDSFWLQGWLDMTNVQRPHARQFVATSLPQSLANGLEGEINSKFCFDVIQSDGLTPRVSHERDYSSKPEPARPETGKAN